MKSYETYLFDLDGTLLDSIDLIVETCRHNLQEVAGLDVEPDLVRRHVGIPLKDQYPIYLKGQPARYSMEEILRRHMDYQLKIWKDHLKLFPGVQETLAELNRRGARLAVVTSRRMATTELYTRDLGIWSYFHVFITPESTDAHKPDPEPAREALRQLGRTADRAVFVGDAVFDMACGHGAGCDTAYVDWGHLPPSEVKPVPTHVISRMSDLLTPSTP